ncbi:hypothetical protein [uncultured Prevotella sp.]|nr:hypothetical protein [uncultured Prevotella sp.]
MDGQVTVIILLLDIATQHRTILQIDFLYDDCLSAAGNSQGSNHD